MFFWLSFFGLRGEIPPNLSLLYMDLIKVRENIPYPSVPFRSFGKYPTSHSSFMRPTEAVEVYLKKNKEKILGKHI